MVVSWFVMLQHPGLSLHLHFWCGFRVVHNFTVPMELRVETADGHNLPKNCVLAWSLLQWLPRLPEALEGTWVLVLNDIYWYTLHFPSEDKLLAAEIWHLKWHMVSRNLQDRCYNATCCAERSKRKDKIQFCIYLFIFFRQHVCIYILMEGFFNGESGSKIGMF